MMRVGAHGFFFARLGRRVASGPFRGMKLAMPLPHLSCLLGIYEHELFEVWQSWCEKHETFKFIDIGAADGYYAVGLALQPQTKLVKAFEASEERQAIIRANAKVNHVADRVLVAGWCGVQELTAELEDAGRSGHKVCLLCDIEGGERDLLDPARIPMLRYAHIAVEIHGDCDRIIDARFSATHEIRRYVERDRSIDDLPALRGLAHLPGGKTFLLDAMDDRRHQQGRWFHMIPRSSAAQHA